MREYLSRKWWKPGVRIEVSLTGRVNLAFHQNAVPFLREMVVVSDGEGALADVELELSSEPGFLKSRTWHIESVGAGQRYHMSGLDVTLSEVLSEGERRALSLAAFLAEQSIGGGSGCLVFDDPVSSLDHWWACRSGARKMEFARGRGPYQRA